MKLGCLAGVQYLTGAVVLLLALSELGNFAGLVIVDFAPGQFVLCVSQGFADFALLLLVWIADISDCIVQQGKCFSA